MLNKRIRSLEQGVVLTTVLVVGMIICRLIQLWLCCDSASGLLEPTIVRYLLDVLLAIFFLAVVAISIGMSTAIRLSGKCSACSGAADGIGLLLAGAGFLLQGILGLFGSGSPASVLGQSMNRLSVLLTILAFCSAAAMAVAGGCILSGKGKPPAGLFLLPTIWGMLLVPFLLESYPNVVSVQSDREKMVLAVSALLYAFYLLERYSLGTSAATGKVLLCLLFPCIALVGTLPLLLASLFGMQSGTAAFPHFALFGLAVAGGISWWEMSADALFVLYKKRRLEVYSPEKMAD